MVAPAAFARSKWAATSSTYTSTPSMMYGTSDHFLAASLSSRWCLGPW
jgi:hypothetical protein